MESTTDDGKKKKTKSRTGCLTCKRKRLKCDETRPACLNCVKKNYNCGGYATKFKWKPFNDESPASNPKAGSSGSNSKFQPSLSTSYPPPQLPPRSPLSNSNRDLILESTSGECESKGVSTPLSREGSISNTPMSTSSSMKANNSNGGPRKNEKMLDHYLELASISMTGKTMNDIKVENYLISKGLNPNTDLDEVPDDILESKGRKRRTLSDYSESGSPPAFLGTKRQRSYSTNSRFTNEVPLLKNGLTTLAEVSVNQMRDRLDSGTPETTDGLVMDSRVKEEDLSRPGSILSKFSLLYDDYEQTRQVLHQPIADSPAKNSSGVGDLNLTPSLSALISYAFTGEQRERVDFFEMPLSPLNLNTLANNHGSPDQTSPPVIQLPENSVDREFANTKLINSHILPSPGINQLDLSLMSTASKEQIIMLYSEHTCLIMSIKNGPNENPWRSIIIPLATKYSCLFNSIASMTFFHLSGGNPDESNMRLKGFHYMKKCILELATDLTKVTNQSSFLGLPSDIALTTCLNLCVSECWDRHISSGIAHLKGAKSMIHRMLGLLKQHKLRSWKNSQSTEPKISILNSDGESLSEEQKQLATVDRKEWVRITSENIADMRSAKSPEDCIIIPSNVQFLFNAWIYFEVLAQMTTDITQDDKGIDLVETITKLSEKNKKKSASSNSSDKGQSSPNAMLESGELEHTSYPMSSIGSTLQFNFFEHLDSFHFENENIDPLLGCAQSLFLIMSKAAALICKIRKENYKHLRQNKGATHKKNNLSTITSASQLKQELVEWKPTISANMMGSMEDGNTWDVSSCIATAEAYRYATLIYLHQAVPEIPSLTSHAMAGKIFILLASTPFSSNTYIVHLFPLLIASCEAHLKEEREWCTARFQILWKKISIGNIQTAFQVVQEVWKRRDSDKKKNAGLSDETPFNVAYEEKSSEPLLNLNTQLSGLMAAINGGGTPTGDGDGTIFSRSHWSSIMREWGWEILLG